VKIAGDRPSSIGLCASIFTDKRLALRPTESPVTTLNRSFQYLFPFLSKSPWNKRLWENEGKCLHRQTASSLIEIRGTPVLNNGRYGMNKILRRPSSSLPTERLSSAARNPSHNTSIKRGPFINERSLLIISSICNSPSSAQQAGIKSAEGLDRMIESGSDEFESHGEYKIERSRSFPMLDRR